MPVFHRVFGDFFVKSFTIFQMDNIDDPYIHRLSEELHDLSILSEEIKKQNEYLTRLSHKTHPQVKKSCPKCKSLEKCRCVIETRTSDRTKSFVSKCNATKPLSQNHKASPCVNNSVNPVLNSFSKSIRCNGSGVNVNSDAKFNEDFCGKRLENGGMYCVEVDQFSSADGKREENRSLITNGSSSESFDSSDKGKMFFFIYRNPVILDID